MCRKAVLVARCCDGRATLDELQHLYEHDREITFETFARNVDLKEVSEELGYAYGRGEAGVRLRKDPFVRFYRSEFRGKRCWHLDWSAIDHIYIKHDLQN